VGSVKLSWTQWWPFRPWRLVATVDAADEVPDKLPPRGMVLVGSKTYPKWLAFDCPCKQNHRILIPLDKAKKPHWRVSGTSRVSLTPSVDAFRGRVRCHYVINEGGTKWV
jgi:hypothetical protein